MPPTRSVSREGMPNRSLRRAAIVMPTKMPMATKSPKVRMWIGPSVIIGNE